MLLLRNPFSQYLAPLWYLLYSSLEFSFLALLQKLYLFLECTGVKNPPYRNRPEINIKGKVVVITGANSGLGKHAALEMAKRGAVVILACRDLKKGEQAKQEIIEFTGNKEVELHHLDVSIPSSVHQFVYNLLITHPTIDILINNAGISLNHPNLHLTPPPHNWELHMATNHLGHFLLTNLLLPSLQQSSISRVVSVSSTACIHTRLDLEDMMLLGNPKSLGFMNTSPYTNSKFAQALFTKELHNNYHQTGLKCYNVCPGLVNTDILRKGYIKSWIMWPLIQFGFLLAGQPVHQGVDTLVLCAVGKEVEDKSGKFFRFGSVFRSVDFMLTEELADKVWRNSEEILGMESWKVDKVKEEMNGNDIVMSNNNDVSESHYDKKSLNTRDGYIKIDLL